MPYRSKVLLLTLAACVLIYPIAPSAAQQDPNTSSNQASGLPGAALQQSVKAAQTPGLSAAGLQVARHYRVTPSKILELLVPTGLFGGVGGALTYAAFLEKAPGFLLVAGIFLAAAGWTALYQYYSGHEVIVKDVRPGPATQAGLRPGDVITSARVGETLIKTRRPKDLDLALEVGRLRNKSVALDLYRDNTNIMLYIDPAGSSSASGVQQAIEGIGP
ncbi:MAG: hypothetical protein HYY16_15305 [Planctomycetes bacterium]|nr:hypothetical protein [Planctomycetota bacterium]